jgi:acyl-homoserine-lactone acylase
MKKIAILLLLFPLQLLAQVYSKDEITRWEQEAKQVTIIRDNWGIPHIYGKTDAHAVFGLLYAQCEDDFNRVEMNYIEKLGRMAEVKGGNSIYDDLLIRLVIDSSDAKDDYKKSPDWLKKLMNAYADGINYFLYKHPQVKPALLNHFEPWYPLLWTDGSIGAISTADISEQEFKNFYSGNNSNAYVAPKRTSENLTGSNGFAISPKITESGNAILYINPHVTFYFRPEVHMVSEEGLNVYGAVTWGQFFVYQGFNEHCGWMHTSSGVDAADSYIEKLSKKNNGWVYEYEHSQKPVIEKPVTIRYKQGGTIQSKTFTALFTHHGPIMAKRNGQYLSMRADNRILNGLIQCWQRNKTKSFEDFKKTLDLRGNISNNTVYADAEGNIAYWHGNRIPVRDPQYDWSKPVDGSIAATEWKGLHTIDQTVHLINPVNGWLQNCNSTPFTVAGVNSPKKENYPAYMAPDGENFRGINAVRVLSAQGKFNLDKVIAAGYDRYLTAFAVLIPALVKAFESLPKTDSLYSQVKDPMTFLKAWDYRCEERSIATTLAVGYGEKVLQSLSQVIANDNGDIVERVTKFTSTGSPRQLGNPLLLAINDLKANYGAWQIAWGDINRFQRNSGNIDQQYKDYESSLPIPFVSSTWGMLPSYVSRYYPGTNMRYGVGGNSFICAVEFIKTNVPGAKKIKAKSLLAGGESGDPKSKHFFDQGLMYTKGEFKDVLFYKDDVMNHAERSYHPGE